MATESVSVKVHDVIVLVENNAGIGGYFNGFLANYIIPSIEYFNGGPHSQANYGSSFSCTLFSLVTYHDTDWLLGNHVSCTRPTTSAHDFLKNFNKIDFCGSLADETNGLADGLSTALQLFDDMAKLREPSIETTKCCIILCDTAPGMQASAADSPYGGLKVETILSMMTERGIKISLISPRKLPVLLSTFEKVCGEQNKLKNITADSRHLVLLNGFELPERASSPALKLEVGLAKAANPIPPPADTFKPPRPAVSVSASAPAMMTVPENTASIVAPQPSPAPATLTAPTSVPPNVRPINIMQSASQLAMQPIPQLPMQPAPQLPMQPQQQPRPTQPQQQQPQAPQQPDPIVIGDNDDSADKQIIWSGALEWQQTKVGEGTRQTNTLTCYITAAVNVQISAAQWPRTLSLQVVPQDLVRPLQDYIRQSSAVAFHFNQSDAEALKNLLKFMSSGFAGLVNLPPGQDIRIMILLFSHRKRQFIGVIPTDQTQTINALKMAIAQHKKLKPGAQGGASNDVSSADSLLQITHQDQGGSSVMNQAQQPVDVMQDLQAKNQMQQRQHILALQQQQQQQQNPLQQQQQHLFLQQQQQQQQNLMQQQQFQQQHQQQALQQQALQQQQQALQQQQLQQQQLQQQQLQQQHQISQQQQQQQPGLPHSLMQQQLQQQHPDQQQQQFNLQQAQANALQQQKYRQILMTQQLQGQQQGLVRTMAPTMQQRPPFHGDMFNGNNIM